MENSKNFVFGKNAPFGRLFCPCFYRIMQMSPPEPSLMMRWRVSRSFSLASWGIRLSLAFRSSFTSSWRDLPKMLASQILLESP